MFSHQFIVLLYPYLFVRFSTEVERPNVERPDVGWFKKQFHTSKTNMTPLYLASTQATTAHEVGWATDVCAGATAAANSQERRTLAIL